MQIYSRVPNPGEDFIEGQLATLAALGYPANDIARTPQDCSDQFANMSVDALMAMMRSGMQA